MAQQKKAVEAITSMDVDFAQWYTDVVKKAELADYSSVKGCIVYEPYGYAIWENIQREMDTRFKKLGVQNVAMPMLIPESLLQKEKDHIDGFAPECAVVTQGGGEALAEKLYIRPTSEVLFCEHYQKKIHSYRDLPKLYNQWCSVVRWEKTTRPFLRGMEFLWQEGHTMHETAQEAEAFTLKMLRVYEEVYRDALAIPPVVGKKTEKEKFAGAVATYTLEPMMHNGVALQGGTTHFFGDGFANAFGITFTGRDNQLHAPFQTSWGMSTRLIGAVIMVHGDDNGLVLPPRIAPTQVVIVPIAQHKPGVLEKAQALAESLSQDFRVKLDESDNSPGWKFAQYEMQGVPLRIELGPKDIEQGQCMFVRRDTGEKCPMPLAGDGGHSLSQLIKGMLDVIHDSMLHKAQENLRSKTYVAHNHAEFLDIAQNKPGFIKAMWCGGSACEDRLKEETGGVKSRCIPFEEEQLSGVCACCGKPAKHMVYWGRQY
ncbi:proline--tRNA ligase [Acutalibacter caecimuris]|uniref:proline--tRNA ligase n=1 Tax=Acutalibacter caecimuris TaxID=3093657 RepID=UPI002AC918BB|nr:proline--tRNA ligase [Acutalibacter sp. M00118]